jgi:hypothetical protein
MLLANIVCALRCQSFVFVAATSMAWAVGFGSAHRAWAQGVEAKLNATSKIFCSYYDAEVNKDTIGIVVGLASCHEGDAERMVAYKGCDEPQQRLLARKYLKTSEVDCNGVPHTPHDWSFIINARILSVEGEKVIIEYEGVQGKETFSFQKGWLGGLLPKANGTVTFLPKNLASKEETSRLGENFAKFVAANKTGLSEKPEGLVGLVMK